ncbi:MAG: NAD(P)/FAD-dependent oxidoreductase [Firmicutes bacterium]|nr:NAD(P)/FAD-dependent oxidoreductase [Candidatus Colimorpha enterica]
MKIVVRNIRLPVDSRLSDVKEQAYSRLSAVADVSKLSGFSVCRKSVDARHREVTLVYSALVETEETVDEKKLASVDSCILAERDPFENIEKGVKKADGRPLVVGFGPCGMFAALSLAEQGYKPIVIERGASVTERMFRVGRFLSTGELDCNTNIQFGAGGAGTFSDGKLVTRINDGNVRYVLEKFAELGAPAEILTEAKPHIGTDKLIKIVSNIDARIRALGGEIRYGTCLRSINAKDGRVISVVTDDGEIKCGQLILAIGHSSRDTLSYLLSSSYTLTPKPFSVGVRIEHLREDIDKAIYGKYAGHKNLAHAEYALSYRRNDDCVYSFCMCPGGEVIAAASEENGVVTNGMSRYARNGVNSNAALVVNVAPDDPVEFQRKLERDAFRIGGGNYAAPVQTVGDFLSGKASRSPGRITPTYMHGKTQVARIDRILPERVTEMLKTGLKVFNGRIAGFAVPDAVLTGVETRTSSPYRINRTEEMKAIGYENLYPCGEGAGYAGGITSAAVDGVEAAIQIIKEYSPD